MCRPEAEPGRGVMVLREMGEDITEEEGGPPGAGEGGDEEDEGLGIKSDAEEKNRVIFLVQNKKEYIKIGKGRPTIWQSPF